MVLKERRKVAVFVPVSHSPHGPHGLRGDILPVL